MSEDNDLSMNLWASNLSMLRTCEDDYVQPDLTPETVVCVGVWGSNFRMRAQDVIEQHALHIVALGSREEGVAARFASDKEAAIFRLFYEGETLAGS